MVQIARKVLNAQSDTWLVCCWDDCEKVGYDLYKAVVNYGNAGNDWPVKYVFCCERHKQYWINSQRGYGQLPSGYKLSMQ